MTDDYGGNYHPPHAIQHISYLVDTGRPQIFNKPSKFNNNGIKTRKGF